MECVDVGLLSIALFSFGSGVLVFLGSARMFLLRSAGYWVKIFIQSIMVMTSVGMLGVSGSNPPWIYILFSRIQHA